MAKPDVRRDYYADLGLAPSAEGEDIKKQFRKLALKYHPDKNPGRETEFNAKFTAIKTAHDLLSDPHQRLKYDTDRLRAGYGKVSGPPKPAAPRRPQPTAFKPAPPRPQYNPPPFTKPQPTSNGPSAGAKRYEAHARAGPQSWQKPRDEAQTRADAFKGFSGMRGSSGASAGWRGFDPNTGRSNSGGVPRQQNQPFGKSRPQSAYERFHESYKNQNPSPTSPKKKTGYAPGASGDDEPMARNTSAYTSSSRPNSMYFDPPPPTAKKPPIPEPPLFSPEYERTSSRYATAGGEKTFFTSSGLGRSSTVRTPSGGYRTTSARTNPSSPTPAQHERHRSASPKAGRNRTYSVSETSSDLDDDTSEEEIPEPRAFKPKPKAIPKSRMRHRQKFPDIYGQNDSSSSTGENPYSRQSRHQFRLSQTLPGSWNYRRRPRYHDRNADLYRDKGHNSDAAFSKNQQPQFSNPASRYEHSYLFSPPISKQKTYYSPAQSRPDSAQSKPTAQSMFGNSGNLHKKFSEEDWRDHISKFDFIGAHANSRDASRSSPKANMSRESSGKLFNDFKSWKTDSSSNSGFTGMPKEEPTQSQQKASNHTGSTQSSTNSPNLDPFASVGKNEHQPQPQSNQKPTPFAQAKFSADQWSEQLQNLSWNVADADRARQSGSPSSRSPKKPARPANKVRSGPQPARVATEAEESKETINGDSSAGSTSPAGVEVEPEAMDLDDEVPPVHPTASAPPTQGPASASANTGYPNLNGHAARTTSSLPKETDLPQTGNGVPKAEARTPLFNLDNLRNTAPFTSTNSGGIENLEDVLTTLPFESKAKQPTSTKEEIRPRELKLPNPPRRPIAPELVPEHPGSQKLMLPRDKWNYYVSTMGSYMHEWNAFNRRMLLHFNTRQDAIETGLAPGWMSAVGDSTRLRMDGADDDATPDKNQTQADKDLANSDDLVPGRRTGGYSAYLRGIEEDVQVRKHWEVACEMHRECILDLGRLRNWIRNGGKVA